MIGDLKDRVLSFIFTLSVPRIFKPCFLQILEALLIALFYCGMN